MFPIVYFPTQAAAEDRPPSPSAVELVSGLFGEGAAGIDVSYDAGAGFVCPAPGCGKLFTVKHNCSRHFMEAHKTTLVRKTEEDGLVSASFYDFPAAEPTAGLWSSFYLLSYGFLQVDRDLSTFQPFMCSECGRSFSRKERLTYHMQHKHKS